MTDKEDQQADEMTYKYAVAMFMWLTTQQDDGKIDEKEARKIIHHNIDRMIDRHLAAQKPKCPTCGVGT